MTKYIFVTGGVVSSLGKGLVIIDRGVARIAGVENQFSQVYDSDYIFTVLSLLGAITGEGCIDGGIPPNDQLLIKDAQIMSLPYTNQKMIRIPATSANLARG